MNQIKKTGAISLMLIMALMATACVRTHSNSAESAPETNDNETVEEAQNETQAPDDAEVGGDVQYLSAPELWSTFDILSPRASAVKSAAASMQLAFASNSEAVGHYSDLLTFAKVGTLQKAPYEGQALVNVWEACDGPCPSSLSRWAVDEATDQWTHLDSMSDENDWSILSKIFTDHDASFTLPELVAPTILNWNENSNLVLLSSFVMEPENAMPFDFKNSHFTSFVTPLDGGCVFGVFPDGTAARYIIAPKFMEAENPLEGLKQNLTHESELGEKENDSYMLMAGGGCGFIWGCARTVKVTDWSELKTDGKIDGTAVYTLANASKNTDGVVNKTFVEVFENYKMRSTYDTSLPKYKTIEEFLANNHVYLAKVSENMGAMVLQDTMVPAAECGKPVIYLYPEKAQEISVKVNIDRFAKTIPAHGRDGWTVWAEPNGKLTNKADGQNYPYLFWEGQKDGSVAELGQSFTLARAEIKSKLPEILKDLGLNAQEAKDFMTFWAPRMLAEQSPYVEVAFAGTKAMNAVAPLEFSEQPDTLIRLFMVYQPSQNAGHPVPDFNTPVRNGFTVIEWGGLLQ